MHDAYNLGPSVGFTVSVRRHVVGVDKFHTLIHEVLIIAVIDQYGIFHDFV